jgi:hypothetical protein
LTSEETSAIIKLLRRWTLKIRRAIALVLILVGFAAVGTLAHEAGHLTINNLLGGTGEIFYGYTWTSGHMDWATLPKNNIWLVYLGGGVLSALFMFMFFWLPARLTPSKQDVYMEGAVAAHILANLIYAPAELILYYRGQELFEWAYITAYAIAVIIFFFIYIRTLVKWVDGYFNGKNCNGKK